MKIKLLEFNKIECISFFSFADMQFGQVTKNKKKNSYSTLYGFMVILRLLTDNYATCSPLN